MSDLITETRLRTAIEGAAERRGLVLHGVEVARVRNSDEWIATLGTDEGPRKIRLHGNWLMRVGSEVAADIVTQRAARPRQEAG